MKRICTYICLLFTLSSLAQSRSTANRYFNEFAYVKAAELYERIAAKGDTSKIVLSRLGDCYYFNVKTDKSEYWYKQLFDLYEHYDIEAEYYYRYSQSLKANKKYSEADDWLLKFEKKKESDSRGKKLQQHKDYVKTFTDVNKDIEVKNLIINTQYSDFGGFQSDKRMYFSSTRASSVAKEKTLYDWNKQPMLNIYVLKGTRDVRLVSRVNSKYHDANAILTKDGKTMYFTRDNFDGKKLKTDNKRTTHLKIYRSRLKNGIWTPPRALSFNNDDYSTGHPALSADESELYFVSDKPGGYGQTDIYKVKILPRGRFGTPKNLGPKINTEGREMFPFVSDNDQLFFASDGHLGLGLLDIFKSKIDTDNYEEPINIGAPFNSSKDDFAFFTRENYGYFSSNREGGRGDDDIYRFDVKKCEESITGVAYNSKDKTVLPETLVKLISSKGEVLATVLTDTEGRYRFNNVDCENLYTLTGDKKGFVSDKTTVKTEDVRGWIIDSKLFLTPLIIDDQIVINPIYFDFDKWDVREDAEYELEKIVTVMNEYPEMVIRIESHTDSRGGSDYNRILSDKRAKSTRDYIISRGIAANRIQSAKGFGEDQLLNHCNDANSGTCSEQEHQKNRRSYFYIVKGKSNVKSSKE
ncbi:OmpA family protein [Flavobacteriaceae bacterium S356]|uniref:OmpA family protein n=1 Tax=Asprobacillus argus TaxID=3076534 RepID=A0ABU3LJJ5_9FLAO|nr:OmpA family protein [Flavobacteriaceae bacterium S356]